MLLRISNGVLKISLQTLAVAIVLLAVLLIAGRLLLLSMSETGDIEAMLQERGVEYVSLDTVDSGWRMHDPSITIEKLVMKPGGELALEIDRAELRIDTFRSLFSATPIISEFRIDGIRFTLEYVDGAYRVRGFDQGDGEANLDLLLDSLPHVDSLALSGVEIAVEGLRFSGRLVSSATEPLMLSAEGSKKHLSFPLQFEPAEEDGQTSYVRLIGSYRGDPRDPSFSANLFLETEGLDLASALEAFTVAGRTISEATLDSSIWIDIEPGNVGATGLLAVSNVTLDEDVVAPSVDTSFRFAGESWERGSVSIPSLQLSGTDFSFAVEDINVAIGRVDDLHRVSGHIDSINVARVASLLEYLSKFELLPGRFSRAISALSPDGQLKDLHFTTGFDISSARLMGNLDAFSMQAYLGIPSIDRLNGFLSVEPESGFLDIHNDTFEMYFSNMFKAPWPFDAGSGRVAYNLQDGTLRIASGLIELIQGDLKAHGKLSLNLPRNRPDQTWGLTIGIRDADLSTSDIYVPNTIPEDLRQWLETGIRGGKGIETGLTFHGLLYREAAAVGKSHDLFFRVEDASLSYHPDWPLIEELAGVVHVTSYAVTTDDAVARVYNSRVTNADVLVPINSSNKADTVLVSGEADGPLSDGIRILNETPLSETTSRMAEEWLATGDMHAVLRLNVPVGDRKEEEVYSAVKISIEGNRLEMPEFELTIDELRGEIAYDNDAGLTSPSFTGRTFGEPIRGQIESTVSGDSGEVAVRVNGAVDVADLYTWSDQLLLTQANGKLNYETTIHVPYGGNRDQVYVEAVSDLSGVVMALPAPFDKQDPDETLAFSYRQTFADDGFIVDMALDERAKASLKIEDGIAVGGRIHFGTEAFGAIAYDAIRMSGKVPYINFEAWQQTTEKLGELSDVSLEQEIAAHVAELVLNIDELMVYDLLLEDVTTRVVREPGQWVANLENVMLKGNVIVPDADDVDIGIHLDRLSFEEGTDESSDPFADVDPSDMVSIDFSTKQLFLGEEDYGTWSFRFNVVDGVARFDDLTATALGIQVEEGSMAEWHYSEGQHSSRFNGRIHIDDLATTLTRFGYASSVEGSGLKINSDIRWPGSPAMIDVDRIVGAVNIEEGKGRFVQADVGGGLKLLGVFDFASIARRFRLDFSDVIEEGFEFDDISGGTSFDSGIISVTEPLVIDGTGGKFTVGGTVDLNAGTLDNDMIVTLPVNRTLPWYAAYSAIATGPLAGAGVWIAQKLFENQIDQMSSAKYKISGTIEAPVIEFITIFDDEVREAPPVAQSN